MKIKSATFRLFIITASSSGVAARSICVGERLETTQMSSDRGLAWLNRLMGVNLMGCHTATSKAKLKLCPYVASTLSKLCLMGKQQEVTTYPLIATIYKGI